MVRYNNIDDLYNDLDYFHFKQAGQHACYGFLNEVQEPMDKVMLSKIEMIAQYVVLDYRAANKFGALTSWSNVYTEIMNSDYSSLVYLGEEFAKRYKKDKTYIDDIFKKFLDNSFNTEFITRNLPFNKNKS